MTSRFAVVEVEHSTEAPAPVYWRIMRSNSRVPVDQFVAEALMISFPVVMVRVFGNRAPQRLCSANNRAPSVAALPLSSDHALAVAMEYA
jgi:hypothetical protein